MTKEHSRAVQPHKVIGASLAFSTALAEHTGDRTMEMQQQLLLLALYVHGELNQQDLTKHTGTSPSSVTRAIKKLGKGLTPAVPGPGWIEADYDPMNERTKLVRLTPRGRQMLESVVSEVEHLFAPPR